MSGALAERVFAKMITKAGFEDLEVFDHLPLGVDDVAVYPLFTEELVALMRRHIPAERQCRVAIRVVARARRSAPRRR